MKCRNNPGSFFTQLAAVMMLPFLFAIGVVMLPVLLIVYTLIFNLRRLSNWMVDAVLVIGE